MLNEHINLIFSNSHTKTVYLCGDFNGDLLQYDKHADINNFVDQLFSFRLHTLITRPTRITRDTKTLIDNIFTTDLCSHKKSGLIINDISDHLPIYIVTEYMHHEAKHKTYIKKRLVNEERKRASIKHLEKCNWDEIVTEEDANITYNKFINLFTNFYNSNCPVSNHTHDTVKNKKPDKPWMTNS